MKKSLFFTGFLISSFANASEITPEMRKKAEETIASCEKTYQNVKEQGRRLDNIKKPNFLGSKEAKEAYKNKEAYKKVFDLRFAEFTKFTNDKIRIRTSQKPSELRDLVAAYSSNCARFAGGLVEFVEWTTKGKPVDKITETIFKDWMKEAK